VIEDLIRTPSTPFRRIGRVSSGSTVALVIESGSVTADPVPSGLTTKDWPLAPGDLAYVEGRGANPLTVAASGGFDAQGPSLRFIGGTLDGTDWSQYAGRLVVVTGTHADSGVNTAKVAVAVNPDSIAAGATLDVDVTVAGAGIAAGQAVAYAPPALTAGLVVAFVRAKAADTVTVRLYNSTAAAIDEPSGSWTFWAVR
jgi:hypothetical protein